MRITETSELIGCSRSRTYELVRAGIIPSIKIGGSTRVPYEELKVWIKSQVDGGAGARG